MNETSKIRCSRRRWLKFAGAGLLATSIQRAGSFAGDPARVRDGGTSLIASVRNLGPQFVPNPVGITGLDGATSIRLPSKESLWLFGDTVEGPFESIRKLDLTNL